MSQLASGFDRVRWQRAAADPRSAACALGFGSIVALGFSDGGYYDGTWHRAGLALGAVAGIGLLLGRGATPGRLELLSLSALAGLAMLTLLSAGWGIAGTEAVREAERCALYVVGLAALLLVAQPPTIQALLNGVLGGVVVLAAFGTRRSRHLCTHLGSVSGLAAQGTRRLCERPRVTDGTRRRPRARPAAGHRRHPAGRAHSSGSHVCGRSPADLEPRSMAVRGGRSRCRSPPCGAVGQPSSRRSRAPGSSSCSSRRLGSRSETGRRTGTSRSRMRRNTSSWDPARGASTTTGSSTGPSLRTYAMRTASTSKPLQSSASSGSHSYSSPSALLSSRQRVRAIADSSPTAAAGVRRLSRPRRARLGLGDARDDVRRPRVRRRAARKRAAA